jgi:hypothetical protein
VFAVLEVRLEAKIPANLFLDAGYTFRMANSKIDWALSVTGP